MNTILYPSAQRGHVNMDWLDSHHSFSFGQWYDPEKIHFGALRVLNDDIVKGGGGFNTHPHDNMEIVSIPLMGSLAHQDSTGTNAVIKTGDVQIMSAGTGIRHSEFNPSKTETVNFLQIWIFPKKKNIQPRYDQKTFDANNRINKWQVVVSPDESEGGVWINQDARLALAKLEKDKVISFSPKFTGNGVYVFVIDGEVEVAGLHLNKKDAAGVSESHNISIKALKDSEVLSIEVPMNITQ